MNIGDLISSLLFCYNKSLGFSSGTNLVNCFGTTSLNPGSKFSNYTLDIKGIIAIQGLY